MSSSFDDGDPRDSRLLGMVVGVVIDRADPLKLGRVRVKIPGMFEEGTAWAKPLTVGGGTRNTGLFFVPEVGAEVAIWFNQGDPDEPYYQPAHWGLPDGQSEVPAEAFPDGADDSPEPDNRVIAVPGWRIEIDATDGQRKLRLTNQKTGDNITLDQERNSILIQATTSLQLVSEGEIVLDATMITIGGRPVKVGLEESI